MRIWRQSSFNILERRNNLFNYIHTILIRQELYEVEASPKQWSKSKLQERSPPCCFHFISNSVPIPIPISDPI